VLDNPAGLLPSYLIFEKDISRLEGEISLSRYSSSCVSGIVEILLPEHNGQLLTEPRLPNTVALQKQDSQRLKLLTAYSILGIGVSIKAYLSMSLIPYSGN
jgi:hypothetical protein